MSFAEIERRPESAYSLSKLVGETIADQYCRWDPKLKIISLRFSNVMLTSEYKTFEGWQNDPQSRRFNHFGYIDVRIKSLSSLLIAYILFRRAMEVKQSAWRSTVIRLVTINI